MQAPLHDLSGSGKYDSEAAVGVREPALSSDRADRTSSNSVDYRALYFEAAGHRNSLLIEIKSLKSHLVLLNQECATFGDACVKANETLKIRQEELDQLKEQYAHALAQLDRFEHSIWGRLRRLRIRLVTVISRQRNGSSSRGESIPDCPHSVLNTGSAVPPC
jgi:chromosome segregation ATPase